MKHLTLVILLALAPLSFGEDELVLYCVGETRAFYDEEVPFTSDIENWKETFRITEKKVQWSIEGQRVEFPIVGATGANIAASFADEIVVSTVQFWQDDKNSGVYQMYFSNIIAGVGGAIIHGNCTKF